MSFEKEAQKIIYKTCDMLENENFHSVSSVPENLWNDIKDLIPDENKIKVANAIANNFNRI